ncbi:hypothetical protein DXG03_008324 [Asterophora parasitica]|uniref:F-box domain-containing protein n=1 Tax=Asterophora parasitica TaxID=117018 RepID=A0A9P7G465_9AGAR|nr:hypothetical protein DXG03_008324 [Asterophora parasitica]
MAVLLPLEVLEIILEALSDDPSTLRQCSIVSKSFLVLSRKVLFSVIQLYSRFTVGDGSDSEVLAPPCDRLYDVLRKNPCVAAYVREIHIIGPCWAYTSDVLPPLLEMVADCGLLEVFTFRMYGEDMTWQTLPAALKAAFIRVFQLPALRAVQLGDVCFGSFPLEMFAMPPRLKHIGHFYVYQHEDPQQAIPESAVLPSSEGETRFLDSLEIGGATALPLVDFLVSSACPISVSRLRSLSLHSTGLGLLDAARKIISVAGGSIEMLSWLEPSLPWSDDGSPVDHWDPLNFQALDLVRVMTIQLMLSSEHEVINVLEACGLPPNIEELIFVVEPSDTEYALIFDAGRGIADFLDEKIARLLQRKAHLRQIRLVVILWDDKPVTLSMFQHFFPILHATGNLVGQFLKEGEEGIVFADVVKRKIGLRGRFDEY